MSHLIQAQDLPRFNHLTPYFGCFILPFLIMVTPDRAAAQQPHTPSPNNMGTIGLNNIPSARMDEQGRIRAGISTLDPYMHGWLSFQLADPLSITLRQSAHISSLTEKADSLYPGLDIKLRLAEETRSRPEIALGLQSAFGHKRMAGEYAVLSKRFHNFDFTAGLGWGRFGQANHLQSPLARTLGHFDTGRPNDGLNPSSADDWFTGNKTAFFGGVEYFTSIHGLSYKFDYFDDPYSAEKAAGNYDAPAPWSVALNYSPYEWGDISLGMQGTDKVMARISLSTNIKDLRTPSAKDTPRTPFRPFRTGLTLPAQMQSAAARDNIQLYEATASPSTAQARLLYTPHQTGPAQLSQAYTHMANHAGPSVEALRITPQIYNLQGQDITVSRRDLERAAGPHKASAEEIWRHTEFTPSPAPPLLSPARPLEYGYGLKSFEFVLDNHISLSEEDNGELYRSALVIKRSAPKLFGFLDSFASLRVNIKDNLYHLTDLRPASPLPVRSDVNDFTKNRVALDTLYSAYTRTLTPDLHMAVLGGYLEEMYAGAGGEILYRPFGKRFALGAESWLAFKRDPHSTSALSPNGDHIVTGHLNGWYDLPGIDTTLKISAGRYLAGDIGTSAGLIKTFENGAKLEGFISLSGEDDYDVLGGTTHQYHGVKLSMPLGGYKYAPRRSRIDLHAGPIGRDTAQRLENPLPLYETTEPFSLQHLSRHWHDMTNTSAP